MTELENDPEVVSTLQAMKRSGNLQKSLADGTASDFLQALKDYVTNSYLGTVDDVEAKVIAMWRSVISQLGEGWKAPGAPASGPSASSINKARKDQWGRPDMEHAEAIEAMGALGRDLLNKAAHTSSSAGPPRPITFRHEDLVGPQKLTKGEKPVGDLFGVSRLRKSRAAQDDGDWEPVRKSLDG